MKLHPKRKKPRSTIPRVGCPFCWEWLPAAKAKWNVFSSDAVGGQCECGAFFIVDETGKLGGQALLDVQALAVDGDLDKALTLKEGADFELKTKDIRQDPMAGHVHGNSYLSPKVWAIKLI